MPRVPPAVESRTELGCRAGVLSVTSWIWVSGTARSNRLTMPLMTTTRWVVTTNRSALRQIAHKPKVRRYEDQVQSAEGRQS
jgi:hypothetical protein